MNKQMFNKERKIVIAAMIITSLYYYLVLLDEFFVVFMLCPVISLILGFSVLDEKADLKKIKRNLIINAIVSVFCLNFINLILYIWASESVQTKHRLQMLNAQNLALEGHKKKVFEGPKEKITDEAKKIDILLKIGVFLVVLSGVIFSTSNTGPVIDLFKPFFVLILSGIFYVLSNIFKTKVKIKKSENTYYILSQIFIVFFAVALGYFKTLGSFLSFGGEGEKLVCSFILLLCSLISRNLAKRYEKNELRVVSYLFIYISLMFTLLFFKVSGILIASILLILSIIGFFKIDKENENYHDSRLVLIFVSGLFIFGYCFVVETSEELFNSYLGVGLLIYNLFISTKKYEDRILKQLLMFSSAIFANICLYKLGSVLFNDLYYNDSITNIPFYAILVTLGFQHYFNGKEEYKTGGFVISIFLILIGMINLMDDNCKIILFLTSLILLVYSVLNIYKNEDEKLQKIYFFFQFFFMATLIISFRSLLLDFFNINILFGTIILLYLSIVALASIFEDKFISNIKLDLVLYYILIFTIGFFSIVFVRSNSLIFNLFFLMVLLGYRIYVNKHIKNNDLVNCMVIITSLIVVENSLLGFIPVLTNPILMVVMIVVALLMRKDKISSVFSASLAYLPLVATVDYLTLPYELELILYTVPLLVIVQLVSRFALDMSLKTKTILETISMVLIMFACVFEVNIIIGLFVGVLSLLMIFIGTKNDKFNSLFYTGIIILILNIIVQLFEYWEKIPWFVYTLIAGLGIIFYVTYKEFNKDKKPKVRESKVEYYEEKQYNIRNNIVTGALIIVYLIVSGIYVYNIEIVKEQFRNMETEEKVKELGLDENIYYFSNKNYPILYIIEGNSTDIHKIYNILEKHDEDFYQLHVCWVNKEGMNKAKTTNTNDRYYKRCLEETYYYGDGGVETTYYSRGFELEILNENLYDLQVWGRNSSINAAGFDISYNTYETKDISFCVNRDDISNYDIQVNADSVEAIEGMGNCFKASNAYGNVQVYVNKKIVIPEYPSYDSYTEYDPITGETIYFN